MIGRPGPCVESRRLVAIGRAKDIARGREPQINGLLRDIETPRDLLRCLPLEQQIETSALLVGQPRPARRIVRWVRPRTSHPYPVVKNAPRTNYAIPYTVAYPCFTSPHPHPTLPFSSIF